MFKDISIKEFDPKLAEAMEAESQRPREPYRAYRFRELLLASSNGSTGLRFNQ